MNDPVREPRNGGEGLLLGLKRSGVEYLFANAGTDFPPVIEALAALPADEVPEPVTVPHETAGVGMAHGYWLATGRPQAVMVHVNVGLANAVMGVLNAASDNVPLVMLSGRTPLTETGRPGGRVSPVQYGQEMYDQSAMLAEPVKFRYELRYPEQAEPLAARAVALAKSAPTGPVYLSLPREPLMEEVAEANRAEISARPAATPAWPDPEAIGLAAETLAAADAPLILVQRGDPGGRLGKALADFAQRHGIAVAEPFPTRNVMPSGHPCFLGHDGAAALDGADAVLILDCDVPWIEKMSKPPAGVRLIHVAPDPHFARMPVRGYRTDLAIAADPVSAIEALARVMPEPDSRAEMRAATLASRSAARRARAVERAEAGAGRPMTAEWLSKCLSDAMDGDAMLFSELGALPGFMDLRGPNRFFNAVHAGGLGWGMPAALGAQLAYRDRLVIACIGDGSYMFANPVACHQIAEALELPILTVIKNNGIWNAVRRSVVGSYPGGAAVRANRVPLTSLSPVPDYTQVARASRAHAERVEDGADLPAAIARAVEVIRTERRQALLDVTVAVSDSH